MNLVVDSTPLSGFGRAFFFAAGISAGFFCFPPKYAEYLRSRSALAGLFACVAQLVERRTYIPLRQISGMSLVRVQPQAPYFEAV